MIIVFIIWQWGLVRKFVQASITAALLASVVSFVPAGPATGAPIWTRSDSSLANAWTSITSSSDGSRLAAVETNGFIWTSSDSGLTWTKRTTVRRTWVSITSSSDGSRLAAVATLDGVFTSSDSGVTWTRQNAAGDRAWTSIASSSDGTKLAASVLGTLLAPGNIWTSRDSGVTWTRQNAAGDRAWTSIASSSDGARLVAGVSRSAGTNGRIWTSADSGVTWVERPSPGSRDWIAVASSVTGTHLSAAAALGEIWTSVDSGATWVRRTAAGERNWRALVSSSDGSRLAAVAGLNGNIWTSSDFGTTWVDQSGAGTRFWTSIASSSDGRRLTALGAGVRVWYVILPTVNFNPNGHGESPASVFGVSSIAVKDLPRLTAAGYTFIGWSTAVNGSVLTVDYAPDSNSTLFAQWSANDLKVTFDSQGGSEVIGQTTTTGGSIVGAQIPTRPGYTFAGWYTATIGGDELEFPHIHGQTSDFTLFAQWSANDLKVTFDSQGGSEVTDQTTKTGGSIVGAQIPTRPGYTFAGWYAVSIGGEPLVFPYVHNQTSDFTLYGRWNPRQLAATGFTGPSIEIIALGAIGLVVLGVSGAFRARNPPLRGF